MVEYACTFPAAERTSAQGVGKRVLHDVTRPVRSGGRRVSQKTTNARKGIKTLS